MIKLNNDILLIIFQEFQYDLKTLYSCLLINKICCETTIPILWKNPWILKKEKEKLLFQVIISHLSDDSRNNLNKSIKILTYQKPLFDYIKFCRHLNFEKIIKIIDIHIPSEKQNLSIKNEIFNLFINENTKFTHLYLPYQFDYQIHLIPGAKCCFSEIEFLSCGTKINVNILDGLAGICKSIKELELLMEEHNGNDNYGIVRLIESQKKLVKISLYGSYADKSFREALKNSLIKHADSIQYFKTNNQPTTNILSYFKNLKILKLTNNYQSKWNCLKDLSLPLLQILNARYVPINALSSLIENTSDQLIEIKIGYIIHDEIENKRIIQAIYQHCPNLRYLQLFVRNSNIREFEKLLIKCQYLKGLYIIINDISYDWNNLFEILAKSSPPSLFKFKFNLCYTYYIKLESLKLFFDSWRGRHPMLLQIYYLKGVEDLMENYKSEGIIKKYDNWLHGKVFEWP
ncbi:hypothetical protein C1645_840068 [Glomus cerebriforme]|uniref:F-box domain-containing protein n=1 Tax=Glomus cerebriforme TaxID=658196 RepID=A0A397S6V7_9GLOM|nr:hypothetical protein C1645_840068 [Glomus cerebriforme]